MSPISALLYWRRVPQVAALALISFGLAACSGDMSSRLSQNPVSKPFGFQGDATGGVQPAVPVEPARQSPQYARPQASYPAISAPQSAPPADVGVSGGGRGLASYAPPPQPNYAPPPQPTYAPP